MSVPVGILGLLVAGATFIESFGTERSTRRQAVFAAAQELRFNDEWLNGLICSRESNTALPVGSLKVTALQSLLEREHGRIVAQSRGEHKYIYQEGFRLGELSTSLGRPRSLKDLSNFEAQAEYTLQDVTFLNGFMRYYLVPLFKSELTEDQVRALGWSPYPTSKLELYCLVKPAMRFFVWEGAPLNDFGEYLSRLD